MARLVKTGDWLNHKMKLYEVVIANDEIFVVCPMKRSTRERTLIVKYSKPRIYVNKSEINTLAELGFDRC